MNYFFFCTVFSLVHRLFQKIVTLWYYCIKNLSKKDHKKGYKNKRGLKKLISKIVRITRMS